MVIIVSVFAAALVLLLALPLIMQHLSNSKVSNIRSKVILITGCDSGFGRAFVEKISGKECTVFAGCLSNKSIEEISQTCGKNIIPVLLDVTSRKNVAELYDVIETYLLANPTKQFWGVVNNAGVAGVTAPADFLCYDDYRPIMEVNYFGAVNVTHTFLKLISKNKGRVVNTCSMVSFTYIPYCGPYLASKAAIFAFSESLRREKQEFGVEVCTVCPGAYATNVLANVINHINRCVDKMPQETRQSYNLMQDNAQRGNRMYDCTEKDFGKITEFLGRIQALDLSPVTDAYEHALFSSHPRAVYSPGAGGVALRLLSFLPTFIADHIIWLGLRPCTWWKRHDKHL